MPPACRPSVLRLSLARNPGTEFRGHNGGALKSRRLGSCHELQVRLEVAVVANLLIDLQPIALVLGNDHRIGVRIELDGGGEAEAPLRFEALHAAPRLGHVGVGVDAHLAPFRQDLGITDQGRDRSAFGIEDTDPMIAPIGHIDVAVAVDCDIGGVVELVGPRMAGLLAFAGDIRAKDGHPIGVPGFLDLAVGADARQEPAVWRQLLNPMVLPVRHIDVAGLVEGDAPGLVELAFSSAGATTLPDELTVGCKDLQPVVTAVDDDQIAAFFDCETRRPIEFAITAAGDTPFADEFAVGVEYRDRVGPVIRHVDPALGVVDGDAEGPRRTTVAFAIFEEVGKPFLFAGTTKLRLVDVHRFILALGAAVGGVEDAVVVQAHGLDVIEPVATGGIAPDRMAPIKDTSARYRCQRHSSLLFL